MNVHNLPIIQNDTFKILKQILYPDAKNDESIQMVIDYCKARKLDPMLKPVHIVPRKLKIKNELGEFIKKDGKFVYEERDTILPGISLYRIDASRTGEYCGMSEPEFGEDITENLGNKKVTYPKWCKIIVKRKVNGEICEFVSKEFWKENYATTFYNSIEPTDIWMKRAYGQLAKCTEAQALRKAFPEAVGQEYTKEEMEGKFNCEQNVELIEEKNTTIKSLDINDADLKFDLEQIELSATMQELQNLFDVKTKYWRSKKNVNAINAIIEAKDERKKIIEWNEEINEGEVIDV